MVFTTVNSTLLACENLLSCRLYITFLTRLVSLSLLSCTSLFMKIIYVGKNREMIKFLGNLNGVCACARGWKDVK